MLVYIHILSYYKLFLYFSLYLSDMLDSLMLVYTHICSYYKLFFYFGLFLSDMLDSLSCLFTPLSFFTTNCSFTLVCVYVICWIVSHARLHPYPFLLQAFLYFSLCLSDMLDNLSCSSTPISFLTTSCSFILVCV
jgi:hypothetical protein